MKLLSYIQQHSKDVKLPDGSVEVKTYLQSEGLYANDSNFDVQMAEAKRLAFDGKVTIEEIPDEPQEPTQLDRVEAQATYTAMMTDTLLEG